ncbi:hypothetical protein FJ420_28785 [Mesorhizobium sp. B3-1-3]|uniref:hypothetical protein n=1 Tax=unclassified Mesorhizobium TaxID=325217 RepID=UPI00112CF504|nr:MULTISPECIES: hypothetical protein [unclassified Mesorhizobium]TPI61155.1 hypothetical protein FJ424_22615 [Mesorhizobium sp. B3-1-8]TPI63097.1 hypothetical protein FJ420_28785 [Mesorhizobium sp. B3-1-3]TPJ34094.1 hypothetical protein FJ418_12460 [Mesorhizobium sp. B2-8-3]
MREAAKTFERLDIAPMNAAKTADFQPVRPDCLCPDIGYIACAASMKNHDPSSLKKFIPGIARK